MGEIWTPGSVRTERQTMRLPPEYMKMLAVMAETSTTVHIGLHCSLCNQDISGKNATADKGWIMECACTTYVGANPMKAH